MHQKTDYLVVGTGIAGLTAAYLLSDLGQVTLVTKGKLKESNTFLAQGGVAAVLGEDDHFEKHIEDTLQAGRDHCNAHAVRHLVENGPKAIRFLKSIGVNFSDEPALEAGHSRARVWRTDDFTGQAIFNQLFKAVKKQKNIQLLEETEAVELIVQFGEFYGAFLRKSSSEKVEPMLAKNTILATGGMGQLFKKTTNPVGAGGDGLAMALNAGLELKDMEFMQFHPTAFEMPEGGRHFLLSEALRGAGARVVNKDEENFLSRYDSRAEMTPRDLVARAIYFEKMHGAVCLDMRHMLSSELKRRFPNILKQLKNYAINPSKDLIPITPAAHYMCGGIPVDLKGATKLPGLFAVGEVAYTGVHGANRLASNSLLEAIVFAKSAASSLERSVVLDSQKKLDKLSVELPVIAVEDIAQVKAYAQRIGDIMWENVGIIRTVDALEVAKTQIEAIPARDYRIQHRQQVCQAIIDTCLARRDSLGSPYIVENLI